MKSYCMYCQKPIYHAPGASRAHCQGCEVVRPLTKKPAPIDWNGVCDFFQFKELSASLQTFDCVLRNHHA
jgi:hypothetical protein